MQNSVNKALNTNINITQTSKATNWWSFDETFAGCLEKIISLVNTFRPILSTKYKIL